MTRRGWIIGALVAIALSATAGAARAQQSSASSVPLSFEQTGDPAKPAFVSRRPTHTLTLTSEATELTVRRTAQAIKALRMTLAGANRRAEIAGLDPLPGKVYHATATSRGALAGNATYRRVKYDDVYPGIDVVYYGNERELEFDFVVEANRDPERIRLEFSGADDMRLAPSGELVFGMGGDEIRLKKPRLYQERDGARREVEGGFRIVDAKSHEVAFHVGHYDRNRPLVIDPTIVFATYRGGAQHELPRGLEVNALGEAYLFADVQDPSTLPRTHPHQNVPLATPQPGFSQCFLTKLSRDGMSALYTVIFEGAGCQSMDLAPEVASVNPKIHLTVGTAFHYQRTITQLPGGTLTLEPLQGAYDVCQVGSCGPVEWMRADALGNVYFVMDYGVLELRKIDSQGQLVGAIELLRPPVDGGVIRDRLTSLDIDNAGHAYVTGFGPTPGLFTPTATALQPIRPSGDICTDPLRIGCFDGFVLKIDTNTPGAFEIVYASYLGGINDDQALGVAWDRVSGAIYVTGTSESPDFPTTTGAYAGAQEPGGFLVKLNLDAPAPSSQLMFGTFLRHSSPIGVAVLPEGLPAVIGSAVDGTCGTVACFPLVQSIYPAQLTSNSRPFLSVFSADGASLPFSTFLDSSAGTDSFISAVAANGSTTLYTAMTTNDPSLATPGALQSSPTGEHDALVQAIDVADLLSPNDAPAITLTPSTLDVPLDTPSGATVPLICGSLFTCTIDDSDRDLLAHIVWLGPNGYRLANPGVLPAPHDRAGIIPGAFVILPVGSHTFTLLVRDDRGATGTAALTVNVSAHNTFVGTDRLVALTDARFVTDEYRPLGNRTPVELTFADVTAPGLTWLTSRTDLVPPPPPDLQAGSPPIYYDVQSTSTYDGNIRLCFNVRGMSFARTVDQVQLYAVTGDAWAALANQAMSGDFICGDTPTLGTFALFYPQVPETAITTIAGTGIAEGALDGPGGDPRDDFEDGVQATQSALTRLGRLARDAAGRIYVGDNGSSLGSRIVRIDPNGIMSMIIPEGICDGFSPIAVDASGQTLYCVRGTAVVGTREIIQIDLAGSAETLVASAPEVLAMVIDAGGNLFYSDGRIFRVPADGGPSQLVFGFDNQPTGLTISYYDRAWTLAFDAAGHLLAGGSTVVRISPGADGSVDGSSDETVAQIAGMPGVTVQGYAEPYSGDGLPAAQAMVNATFQMIVASDGAVIFTDQSTRVRRIDPGADGIVNGGSDEIVRTIAGYFSSTPANPSAFATSEFGDFRGLLEDPRSPGAFIVSSHGGHKLQRFGVPSRVSTEPQADLGLSVQTNQNGATNIPVTFTVVVTNHGPSAATDAAVLFPIPAGTSGTFGSSPAGTCSNVSGVSMLLCQAGTLAPGASVTMTFQTTTSVAGNLTATFQAIANELDPNAENNTATAAIVVIQSVDLSVAVVASPGQVHALEPVSYVATVSNLTASQASAVTLNVGLAADLRFESAAPAGLCSLFGQQLTCDVGMLAGNSSAIITIGVTPMGVNTQGATFAVSGSETDANLTNNLRSVEILVDGIFISEAIRVTDTVPVSAARVIAITETIRVSDGTTTRIARPNATIQKHLLDERGLAYTTGNLDAGQTATFRLRATNESSIAPTTGAMTVTDVLDPRLQFDSAASDQRCSTSDGQTIVCSAPAPLAAGASIDFLIVTTVAYDAAAPNQTVDITNQATVATPEDENANDNSASITFTVRGAPPGAPTNPGSNVLVQPTDANNVAQPVSVRFASVSGAGLTSAIPVIPAPNAPPRFQFLGVVYDISTTATVAAPIEVCFNNGPFSPLNLVWHAGVVLPPSAHTVRTTAQLCVVVNSLSPFGVVTPVNQAPTANAGTYPPIEATSAAGASVTLTGSGSDPDGDPLSFAWSEGATTLGTAAQITVPLAIGTHNLTLTVSDAFGGTASSTTSVVVRDTTPPVVTPPAAITVPATEANGARGSAWPALALFLADGSATDIVDAAPTRLSALVGTSNADNSTLFPIGKTNVTFRFRDASGNVGTATSSVTVVLGTPKISIRVTQSGIVSGSRRFFDLQISNTGNGNARQLAINWIAVVPTRGAGIPKLVSPVPPVVLGSLDAGVSTVLRLTIDVPVKVERIAIAEVGTYRNVKSTPAVFIETQEVDTR